MQIACPETQVLQIVRDMRFERGMSIIRRGDDEKKRKHTSWGEINGRGKGGEVGGGFLRRHSCNSRSTSNAWLYLLREERVAI